MECELKPIDDDDTHQQSVQQLDISYDFLNVIILSSKKTRKKTQMKWKRMQLKLDPLIFFSFQEQKIESFSWTIGIMLFAIIFIELFIDQKSETEEWNSEHTKLYA